MGILVIMHKDAYTQCVNLHQMAKHFHSSLLLTSFSRKKGTDATQYPKTTCGDRYVNHEPACGRSIPLLKDITLAQISSACHACDDYDQCVFNIIWDPGY